MQGKIKLWPALTLIIAWLLEIAVICPAVSQSKYELNFRELEGLHGRPVGRIRSITQDPYGNMWFSGEQEKCIYRYDGVKLTLYRKDNFNPNSLGGVHVNEVYADKTGLIWVTLAGDGLDAFNPSTNTFTHYRHDQGNPKSIASDHVSVVLRDSKGRIWVGTDRGLDMLNQEKGEFTHFQNEPGNTRSLSHNFVSCIYEDKQSVIWVATAGVPWIIPGPDDGGLNRLEQDGTFTQFRHDANDKYSLISNKVMALYEDSRGVFWVGTNEDGLHTLDRATGRFERHRYDPANPNKLSRPPIDPDCKSFDIITFITEDHSGAIWIGSMCSGLNRYDPKSGLTINFKNNNGFPDNSTLNGFVSRDGVLWISTQQNKLYRVDPVRQIFDKRNLGFGVSRFRENPDGTVWVGSERGLFLVDNKGSFLKKIDIKDKNGNPSRIFEIHSDAPEVLWLGTSSGAYALDTRTGDYHALDGIKGRGILKIITDQSNPDWKWMTMISGGVLVKYSKTHGVLKRYNLDNSDSSSMIADNTICILDDNDNIWTTTLDGINRFDKKSGRFTHFLSMKGTFIYKDRRGAIWAGWENGLFEYNAETEQFMQTQFHSVIATDPTYGIVEDDRSNLWVSTPSSIVRIDSTRRSVCQFGNHNGIEQGNNIPGALYKTNDGAILLGYNNGYYHIEPNRFLEIEKPPTIFITDFLINGNDDSFNPTNLVKIPSETIPPLTLTRDQNNFSIGFVMSDYRDPQGNYFQVRLVGYDNSWRDLGSQNSSNYFNIPPGKYTFELRGYIYNGSMTQRSIEIKILPPWWKTRWAYASYGLIVIGILAAARKMIVHEERLKASLQLEHLNFEKAKEVDRVRTSFFTNISHEFRTPLTLIKGPVEELLEKYAQDPRTAERLKLIRGNSELLLKLINQLMDLARVEAGSLTLEKTEGDIYSFIRSIADSFDSLARQKCVSLSIELPVEVKSVAYDKGKFETIIINLINNAIKFTRLGGSVHIKAQVDDSTLWLSVKDTGIGIPKEHQSKVFERFHQVSEAHKEVGTGIGLALVKELVTFLGGTIEVVSEERTGSEFIVRLPVERLPEDENNPIEIYTASTDLAENVGGFNPISSGEKNGRKSSDGSKPQILLVEDNVEVRAFIIDCLGPEFDFAEADNGVAGLHTAFSEIPDMIVSDVMMPEMDGILMTQKLKADIRTSHIPLIMLTAKSAEESKLEGLETGADDYLTKPFNKNELLLKVRNAIARQLKLREKLKADIMSSAPLLEVQSQDERFINKVRQKILDRLNDEQLGVESLSEDVGMSRSQLLRKVTALTGISVNELIRKLRLQRAAQLIIQNWGPVTQIAYQVGFTTPSYFAKVFKSEFGVLPSEYLEKFAKTTLNHPNS